MCASHIYSMKLSMWILAKWLEPLRPQFTITDGDMNLCGVRLFSLEAEPVSSYVYVSRGNCLYNSECPEVLVMNRMDVISIRDSDIETVLNEISSAFEFYNNWESELTLASAAEEAEQRIVDCCALLLPVMFVMGPDLSILARSRGYARGEINSIWDSYIDSDTPQLGTVSRMRNSFFNQVMQHRHSMYLYREPEAAPFDYGLMSSYMDDEGRLLGQIVYAADRPIEKWEQQLFQLVERFFCMIHMGEREWHRTMPMEQTGEALLATLIDKPDNWTAQKLCIMKEWAINGPFLLMIADGKRQELEQLRSLTARRFPHSVCIVKEGCILLLPLSRMQVAQKLWDEANEWLVYGESLPFDSLEGIGYALRQARGALQEAKKRGIRSCSFKDCALTELLHSEDKAFCLSCLHPGALALQRFDRQNATGDYAETMKEFLLCGCSYLESSKRLYVHRNTVLSRLEKAANICPVPDKPEERLYLLISLCFLS